jgi:hypothetical protein
MQWHWGNDMEGPRERLPERKDEIGAEGARLQVILNKRDGWRTVEITGNPLGLKALAAICSGLAELTAEELLTPANHYHFDENFWGTEKGSVDLVVYCHADEWQGWPEPSNLPTTE